MQNQPLPAIRTDLQFTVHGLGANLWYAVKSPGNRYLRLGKNEYWIASALDGKRTADEVARAVAEIDVSTQVSPEDVVEVTTWLAKTGLLLTSTTPSAEPRAPVLTFNPVYMKLPLISGRILERVSAPCARLIGWPTIMAMFLLYGIAGGCTIANWTLFATTTGQLFVADSVFWWGFAWLLLKSVHELGHAVMAMHVGSRIRSGGISLIFMAPVPYVDLSDLWAIPSRWQRILCCAGGMLFEMTVASIAALIAVSTENQSLQYFCCAIATMGTVTTLAFNASPLIRFDGYFILSDLINYPNLYSDSQVAARQMAVRIVQPWRPMHGRITIGLVLYGLACYQYRFVMMLSLALGTILVLQGVGVGLVVWGGYAIVISPWLKSLSSKRVDQQNAPGSSSNWISRIWNWENAAGGVIVASICGLLYAIPAPMQPTVPGIVAIRDAQVIRCETEGFLTEVLTQGEMQVESGQVLAKLTNVELEFDLALKRNEIQTVQESIALKRAQGHLAELQANQAKLVSLQMEASLLEKQCEGLNVFSPTAGQLVQNDLIRSVGLFVSAGAPLAMIAQPEHYELVASVDQHDVETMRAAVGQRIEARVHGGPAFEGVIEKVEPRASDTLSEPTLAAVYGGPIAVQMEKSQDGQELLKTSKPRFEMKVSLESSLAAKLIPGQMVWIKLPGHRATLLDALHRWASEKWNTILQQSKPLGS